MIFKNARLFRFTKPMNITADQLEESLSADAFKSCGPQESSRLGWVSPLGKHGEQLVHAADGCYLICLQKQEKILPGSVVSEVVDERVEAIEAEQQRKVRRKEKVEIKDQVTLELLPKAFTRNKRTYAYLSMKDRIMVVDAGSAKVAEDCASALRKSLGSLPVRPPVMNASPESIFTGWLSESAEIPEAVTLGTDCWLVDPSEDGGKITAKGMDLESDDLRTHIDSGMQVTRMSMEWDSNLTFCLDSSMTITRLKFGAAFQEEMDGVDADDVLARFDAAFSLMTREISQLVPALFEVFGGEDRSAIVEVEEKGEFQAQAQSSHRPAPPAAAAKPLQGNDRVDALYDEAKEFVVTSQRASISTIQRKFKIGYNRAAGLVEQLECNGVITPAGNDGARRVMMTQSATQSVLDGH